MAKGARRIKTGNSMYAIEGFEEVKSLLDSLANRSAEVYESELEKVARDIEVDAKSNIHDETGALQSSIKTDKSKSKTHVRYKVLAGGAPAPHAHLVEFGHRQVTKEGKVVGDVPAHPFLRKAFEQNKSRIISALNKALDKLLKG